MQPGDQLTPMTIGPVSVEKMKILAAILRDSTARHRDWLQSHERREQLCAAWEAFFRDYDVLLTPVAPVPAIPHDHSEPMALRVLPADGGELPYMHNFAWMGPVGTCHLPGEESDNNICQNQD